MLVDPGVGMNTLGDEDLRARVAARVAEKREIEAAWRPLLAEGITPRPPVSVTLQGLAKVTHATGARWVLLVRYENLQDETLSDLVWLESAKAEDPGEEPAGALLNLRGVDEQGALLPSNAILPRNGVALLAFRDRPGFVPKVVGVGEKKFTALPLGAPVLTLPGATLAAMWEEW